MTTQAQSGGGISFLNLLALLFIGLKLSGQIGWSWWWVLSPLWIPFALLIAVALIAVIAVCIAQLWRWSMGFWK